MKNNFTTVLLIVLCQCLYAAPTTHTPQLKVNGTNVTAGSSISSSLTTNSINFDLTYSDPSYSPLEVFYDFGDGNYSSSFTTSHMYAASVDGNTVQVKLHTIDDYDEEEDEKPAPKTYVYDLTFNFSGTSITNPPVPSGSGLVLWNSWSVVAGGQDVHYVSEDYNSCPNNQGIGVFVYPTAYFESNITIKVGTTVLSPAAVNVTTNAGSGLHSATFSYTHSPGLTKILYSLVTKKRFPRVPSSSCVTLALIDKNTQAECATANSCGRVGKSHDPNAKYITSFTNACDGTSSLSIDYEIHYQNIGSGAAEHVTVLDYLDQDMDVIDVQYISSKHTLTNSDPAMTGSMGAISYLRWYFKYDGISQSLRGTKEPGYNVDFFEEDTQGWIKFKVLYAPKALFDCNAILNQARIIFDCNEYFTTKNSYAWEDCEVKRDLSCQKGCILNSRPKRDDPYYRVGQSAIGSPLISAALPPGIVSANWYPIAGLDLTDPINPTAKPIENTTYTGVLVDNSCNRYVYHITVNTSYQSGNALQVHDEGGQYIVIGGAPPYTWSNDASFTGSTMASKGAAITITDAHGCRASPVPSPSPPGGFFANISFLLLFAIAVVLFGLFLFLRPRKK